MASEKVTVRWYVDPCIRCPWPVGSRWDGRPLSTEEEAERIEARHEYYCHQGRGQLEGRLGGKTPNHIRRSIAAEGR